MQTPTFDINGYPSEETLAAIRTWWLEDANRCLDFVRTAWHGGPEQCPIVEFRGGADAAPELLNIAAKPGDQFARFSTGGQPQNESLISALKANHYIHTLCWQLSTWNGLHIYRYGTPLPLIVKQQQWATR